jgi:hypothetical protein
MDVIRSVPICALVMAAVWLSTGPTRAQGVLETPEIKAFLLHAAKGDCAYLNEVTDKNITQSSPLGIAAQLYALDALTNESELPPSRRVCRYHDRRTALRVAIRRYAAAAERMVKSFDEVVVTIALEGALGDSWQDKLAQAGVRPAMQDLVALHLLCVRKEDEEQRKIPFWERKDTEQPPIPFWEWMFKEAKPASRYGSFERLLEVYGQSRSCMSLVGNAKPEIACYWNAVEETVATGVPVRSPEMRKLQHALQDTPRGVALMLGMIKDGEPIPSMTSVQSALRKLVAEACAQTLPPETQDEIRKRVRTRSLSSVDTLIAGFK